MAANPITIHIHLGGESRDDVRVAAGEPVPAAAPAGDFDGGPAPAPDMAPPSAAPATPAADALDGGGAAIEPSAAPPLAGPAGPGEASSPADDAGSAPGDPD